MIKKKRLYTYYTIRVRFDNTQEQELNKKFYHTKNKSAFVKECIKKELTTHQPKRLLTQTKDDIIY